MQNFYGSNSGEEARRRQLALDFEERIQQGYPHYVDLLSVEEIFQYYLSQNNLLKAAQLLRYAQQFHVHAAGLYQKEAWLEMEFHRHEQALEAIERALQLDPGEPSKIFMKTEILAKLDYYDRAINLLKGMLSVTLSPKEVLLQMGNVAQLCGKEHQSEAYYRQALDHAPDFQEAVYELAFLLEALEKHGEAIKVYQDFLEKRPYSAEIWYQLGRLLRGNGDLEAALEAYDFAILVKETTERKSYFSALFAKGRMLLDLERPKEALSCLLQANQSPERDVHGLFYVGVAYQNLGMVKDAIRYFRSVVRIDDDYIEAWSELAACLEGCEKYLEAVYYFQKAFRLDEYNERLAFRIACCEYKLGNHFSAREHLELALELEPDDIDIWKGWALLLMDQGSHRKALNFVKKG